MLVHLSSSEVDGSIRRVDQLGIRNPTAQQWPHDADLSTSSLWWRARRWTISARKRLLMQYLNPISSNVN